MSAAAHQHGLLSQGGGLILGESIFRILCTGLLCGLVSSLPVGGSGRKILRLVGGMMLTVSLLMPLSDLDFGGLADALLPAKEELTVPVELGQEYSREQLRQLIIQETEAYILHKAAALEMDITVDVILSDGEYPVPEAAMIRGTWSEAQKRLLVAMMETELGIPKEEQQWMG